MAIRSRSDIADSRTRAVARPPRLDWPKLMVWAMRLLSVAWLSKGLIGWAAILDAPLPGGEAFNQLSPARQTVTVIFAVLDPVAAVGLWLTTNWGGVLWIFAAMSEIIAEILLPGDPSLVRLILPGVLIVACLAVSWRAAQEPEQKSQ